MDNILQVENVSKSYATHLALDGVSIDVPEGKVYGLLGPNGAGKTTLIRIINHITAPDSGRVLFRGRQLTQADVANIGYLPEERGLYKKMKVGEQAMFFARLKGLSRREAEQQLRAWFDKFGIADWWGKKVEELSKGMAQKVQFIVTVLHHPKLLIFDEPFSGFDPINANLLKNEILNLRDEGATVIFSTHNMASVEEICDNITLINKSRNILSGNVAEIRREMGRNSYKLSFQGRPELLLDKLGDRILTYTMSKPEETESGLIYNSQFSLQPDVKMHDFIAAANDAVEIVTFDRALPSMNEIFIRTVEASNDGAPTQIPIPDVKA